MSSNQIKILLKKHSTWEELLDSPDYDKMCELDAFHDYQCYYQVQQLKKELKELKSDIVRCREHRWRDDLQELLKDPAHCSIQ